MSQIGFSLVGSDYGSDSDSESASPLTITQSTVVDTSTSMVDVSTPLTSTVDDSNDNNNSQHDDKQVALDTISSNIEPLATTIDTAQSADSNKSEHVNYPWPPPVSGVTTEWGLPLPPNEQCDEAFQAKIAGWHRLMQEDHLYFNDRLLGSQAFRNPHLYAKLVEFLGLDEFGSNLPKDIYDPHGFPATGYAEAIIKEQQRRAEERALAHHARTQIQFINTGSTTTPTHVSSAQQHPQSTASSGKSATTKRSRWDVPKE